MLLRIVERGRVYEPDRRTLHAGLLDTALGTSMSPAVALPQIVFMAGGSAAGKSRLADPLVEELGAVRVDPDLSARRLLH